MAHGTRQANRTSATAGIPDPPLVAARGITKAFDRRDRVVLDHVDLCLWPGESVAVTGPSGCGKTTLLSIIAGLVPQDSGDLQFRLPQEPVAARLGPALRRRHVGLVFQAVHLIPTLTVQENVEIPLFGVEPDRHARQDRARAMLDRVGLAGAADWSPARLSGGERQRVAVARAFVNRPVLILADEPTGHLDSTSAERVVSALIELRARTGGVLLMVTHNPDLAARMDRQILLLDGRIVDGASAGSAGVAPCALPASR